MIWKNKDYSIWHRWFAWYPIQMKIDDEWHTVWLQFIERRNRHVVPQSAAELMLYIRTGWPQEYRKCE